MYRELQIGKKTIGFLSNGATPLYYKMLFKKDLLSMVNGTDMEIAQDNIPELAFIMAKQADKADMSKLSFEQYVEWVSLFEALDLVMAGAEIAGVYIADSIPMEEPKKKVRGGRKE